MSEDHIYNLATNALDDTRTAWVRWSDDRFGHTVATVLGGEVGDPYAESNVQAAERILAPFFEDGTAEEYTVGRSGRTWLRGIAVTVYDDEGNITPAFEAAVEIRERLSEYPLLDEDDFYEREWNEHYASLALDYGDGVDLVVAAVQECSHDSIGDVIGDHDEVVLLVEEYLAAGNGPDEVVLDGLKHYVEQRKDDLDIPTLAALVG